MNKVILVGRLAADPEVRYTQSGKCVASFNLAVNRYGNQQEADFIRIVLWEKLAELAGNSLSKGSRILIEGRLTIRAYETTDGQKRRVTEVIAQNMEFLEKKSNGAPSGGIKSNIPDSYAKDTFPEEEIPF